MRYKITNLNDGRNGMRTDEQLAEFGGDMEAMLDSKASHWGYGERLVSADDYPTIDDIVRQYGEYHADAVLDESDPEAPVWVLKSEREISDPDKEPARIARAQAEQDQRDRAKRIKSGIAALPAAQRALLTDIVAAVRYELKSLNDRFKD